MKKYFLLAAISAALLLTACGSNENTVETSSQASLITSLNNLTEMTVPAFEPEWDETEAGSSDNAAQTVTETSVNSESEDIVEVVSETTAQIAETSVAQTSDKTSAETEDIFFEATVLEVSEKAILVQMSDKTFIGEAGTDVHIFGSYDVAKGDTVNIVFTEEVGIDESYPPEIQAQFVISIEKAEYAGGYDLPYDSGDNDAPDVKLEENEHAAYVTEVSANDNGGYSLLVEAYDVMGYHSPVSIYVYSETEFPKGAWVKIEFAPETCFMESYPLQVSKSDVLKIELIDY